MGNELLPDAQRTWRLRVRLADRPGQLATLASRLSERDCNLLSVTVLPVAAGDVVDELVLRAPRSLHRAELMTLLDLPGTTCVGISEASVHDLVDTQTAVLRTACALVCGSGTVTEALRHVLGADTVEAALHAGPGEGDPIVVEDFGRRVTIRTPSGGLVVARRAWAPFTDVELARVPALFELLAAPIGEAPAQPVVRRQLSSLDAQFLNIETATTFTHVGGLTLLDPSGVPGGQLRVGALRELVGARLHEIAPLRWRLHQVPFGLDLPYWLDSGTVDLDYHIREVYLPAPGTDEQLGAQVAALAATPLRRDRPLWECYLVHGLSGGRQALYTKVHHALIDGVSCSEVLAVLLDLGPEPRSVKRPARLVTERPPGAAEMLLRGAKRALATTAQVARSAPATLPHLLAPRPASSRSPFNAPISARRAFAFTSLPLDEVKLVKRQFGFTVNDVVMALCTTALRRWLIEHDALIDRQLVAAIPVSVRAKEQIGTGGNQISFMLAALPTDVPDAAERLRVLHESLAAAKARFAATPKRLLHDSTAALPQALHGVVARTLMRAATMATPPFNLIVSNVPGPPVPLYAAGARVIGNYPASVVSDAGGGINITVMSYNGHLDFGITTCPDLVPEVWDIAAYLREALDELTRLAVASEMTPVRA